MTKVRQKSRTRKVEGSQNRILLFKYFVTTGHPNLFGLFPLVSCCFVWQASLGRIGFRPFLQFCLLPSFTSLSPALLYYSVSCPPLLVCLLPSFTILSPTLLCYSVSCPPLLFCLLPSFTNLSPALLY